MLLTAWLKTTYRGKKRSIRQLAITSKLSYTTVFPYCHGKPVKLAKTAEIISAATNGAVSVDELINPQAYGEEPYEDEPAPARKRQRRVA